jgi:hypothetical protein
MIIVNVGVLNVEDGMHLIAEIECSTYSDLLDGVDIIKANILRVSPSPTQLRFFTEIGLKIIDNDSWIKPENLTYVCFLYGRYNQRSH